MLAAMKRSRKAKGSTQTAQANKPDPSQSRKEFLVASTGAKPALVEPLVNHPNSPAQQTALLTRRQLAARWGCCGHTISRMKDLRPVRFNRRRLRYKLEDILQIEAAAVS